MDKHQHRKSILRLIERGEHCTVCGGEITPHDIEWSPEGQLRNVTTPKKDTREGWKLYNMSLKHRSCSIAKTDVQDGEHLEKLYELFIKLAQTQGACYNCKQYLKDGDDPEDFNILNEGNAQHLIHKVCPTR